MKQAVTRVLIVKLLMIFAVSFFLYFGGLYGERGCRYKGEVAEWLKAHAWKVCIP